MKTVLLRTLMCVSVWLYVVPTWAQSNIGATDKFAWGENIGWTNWRDANGATDGVIVGTDFLEGFIWGENVGWIDVGDGTPTNGISYANVNATDFGVNVDSDDDLSGYAWGENIGWINFGWGAATNLANRARFDFGTGRFRGYAWAENVGWFNLDDAMHFVAASVQTGSPCITASDCGLDPSNNACNHVACTGICSYACVKFGDVKNPPNGVVDLDDILCTLGAFSSFNSCPDADVHPCGGNGIVNLDDILSVLAAFAGANPCGCTENFAPGTGVPALCGSNQP